MQELTFLLGGQDLEMQTIRELLERNNLRFVDHHLEWNDAYLSKYANEFKSDSNSIYVAIELNHDVAPAQLRREFLMSQQPKADISEVTESAEEWVTKYFINIDHHDQNANLPSSLEQIARLLNLTLSEWENAVALNDVGHKSAMRYAGVSSDIINKVRQEDRKAQGVTPVDMLLGQQSVENRIEVGDVCIVNALTTKYAAITDFLEKNKLLIYDDSALNYYGYYAKTLRENSAILDIIPSKAIFTGGLGEKDGFFGIARNSVPAGDIEKVKNIIINEVKAKPPFSEHNFLFAFRWDVLQSSRLQDRIDMRKFWQSLDKRFWKRELYRFNNDQQPYTAFNEFTFFYDFVRETLFNTKNQVKPPESVGHDELVEHYKYAINQNGIYEITVSKINQVFELDLKNIELHVYNTGVAILNFECLNCKYQKVEDVLAINDFGRRIYPQFLSENGVQQAQRAFLAKRIRVKVDGNWIADEDFNIYNNLEAIDVDYPISLPDHIQQILGDQFNTDVSKPIQVRPLLDDRLFCLTWIGDNNLATELCARNSPENPHSYTYLSSHKWHQLAFADNGGSTCQSEDMLPEILKKITYDRWIEYNTLYAITDNSFIALSSDRYRLANSGAPPIHEHMRSIYFQLTLLCLLQRASVLRFSGEISYLSQRFRENKPINEHIQPLYQRYIEFINRIYFREVTSQIQGIELYQFLQGAMSIERDVKDLDNEFDEVHRFATLKSDQASQKKLNQITYITAGFLLPAFITGFYGMNILPDEMVTGSINNSFHNVIYCLFSSLLLVLALRLYSSQQSNRIVKIGCILLAVLSVSCFVPFALQIIKSLF